MALERPAWAQRLAEERAPDQHEHHDRRDDGDDPQQCPEGLLLGAQGIQHYRT
jgi:hypothetical protein